MINILKKPSTMFVGIAAGIFIGLFAKALVPFLSPFSEIYLTLLQMCALPMVICTVCINIGDIFSGVLKGVVKRWVLTVLSTLFISSAIGIGIAFIMLDYMSPSDETKVMFAYMQSGDTQSTIEQFTRISYYDTDTTDIVQDEKMSVIDFILNIVPSNIFGSLTDAKTMQVILFFCILGIMVRKIDKDKSKPVLNALDGIYSALCIFIDKLMVLLPFAICAMMAVQFSSEEMISMMGPLFKLILVICIATICIIIIAFFLIQYSIGCTLRQHWKAIRRTMFIAFGTRSCLASIPIALEDCPKHFGINKKLTDATLPISITMCQSGVIISGAVAALFAKTIYDIPLNGSTLAIILLGSVFFSISIIGVPGIVAVNMLGIILDPLGIPANIIIIIYLAIIPIIDPLSVFASVYVNFAVTGIVARGIDEKEVASE